MSGSSADPTGGPGGDAATDATDPTGDPQRLSAVRDRLDRVEDPELARSIGELDYIDAIETDGDRVEVRFTLPTAWCSPAFAWMMATDARDEVEALDWVREARIELCDHMHGAEITTGVNARDTFGKTFPDADGGVAEVRAAIADKEDPVEQTLDFLYTRKKQSGIIYCFSRKQVEELFVELKKAGHSVKPYHAGLSKKLRNRNQELFIRDDVSIIVATIAFGMGSDKPNVRFVMHYDMPKNIESYYQQIGRAGRDGLRSDCLLLYSRSDKQKIQYFINQKEGREKEVAEKHLKDLMKFLESDECRRIPLMKYFGETYEKDECGMCDNCLSVDAEVEDLTVQAQKILSCIARTNEEFDAYYIADILRGSTKEKVLKNGHDELSTYNIGNEWAKEHWILLARLLVKQEYLSREEQHGALHITARGKAVLEGKENVFGVLDRKDTVVDDDAIDRTTADVENNYDKDLFEQLRNKRKELADQQSVPPHAIFPDTTLMEMAYYYPQSKDNVIPIYGVGSVKLKKYGTDFLKIINKYCRANDIEENTESLQEKKEKQQAHGEPYRRIGKEYNAGKSIDHLAEQFGVKDVTIIKHLKKYLKEGNSIRPEGIVKASSLSTRKRDEVLEVMEEIPTHMLRKVYTELDKSVSYSELRIIQLYYMARQNES